MSVIDVPYANSQPGDPSDKQNVLRENLVTLCPIAAQPTRPSTSNVSGAKRSENDTRAWVSGLAVWCACAL